MSTLSLTATRNMCLGLGENGERKRRTIKLGGFAFQIDGMTWFILALFILAIAIAGLAQYRNSGKISSQKVELTTLRDAIYQYQSIRIDGAAPATLDQLIADPSISANQAIDGINHGAFIAPNGRWQSSGAVVDMWGAAYTYSVNADGSGSITSTGSGKNISIDF